MTRACVRAWWSYLQQTPPRLRLLHLIVVLCYTVAAILIHYQ